MEDRFAVASPEWLRCLQEAIREIALEHGTEGVRFRMCEVFLGAPAGSIGMQDDGRAAWHLRVDGKRGVAEAGERSDVDLKLVLDYSKTLPCARHVVSAEDDGSIQPQIESVEGDLGTVPAYLAGLHNRLAVRTL